MPQTVPFFITSLDVLKIHHLSGTRHVAGRPFHCLSYAVYGKMGIHTDAAAVVSDTGCVTFVPQGVSFTSSVDGEREIIAIHFTVEGEFPDTLRLFRPSRGYDFGAAFQQMYELFTSSAEDAGFTCMSQFYRLLGQLFDRNSFRSDLSGYNRRIQPALDYISRHYAEAGASDVEHLASLCGFSAAYLRRLMVSAFGMSTVDYVKRFRIDKACSLLHSGFYSVTEVSMLCGFNSPSYFSKEFKRHVGISPSDYQQALRPARLTGP